MPRERDADTHEEAEMDNDDLIMKRAAEKVTSRRQCRCGTMAVLKTVFDRDGVAYHCGSACRQWWIRVAKPLTLDKLERNNDGFAR